MKLDQQTLKVLKNFSLLNPSLLFKPGNELTTITPTKTVLAKATIQENIPKEFVIMELSKFLNVLSLFENPVVDLKDSHISIKSGNQEVQYSYGIKDNIVFPNEKEIKLPDMEIRFKLTTDILQGLFKAMSILNTPEIAVTGENGIMCIETTNTKNPLTDKFRVEVGTCLDKMKFKMIMLADNLKIVHTEYDVGISSKGIAHFKGNGIEYFIATESSSTFEA